MIDFWSTRQFPSDDNFLQKIGKSAKLAPMNNPLHARAAGARSGAAPLPQSAREIFSPEKSL
jgi:hypothetical protein